MLPVTDTSPVPVTCQEFFTISFQEFFIAIVYFREPNAAAVDKNARADAIRNGPRRRLDTEENPSLAGYYLSSSKSKNQTSPRISSAPSAALQM